MVFHGPWLPSALPIRAGDFWWPSGLGRPSTFSGHPPSPCAIMVWGMVPPPGLNKFAVVAVAAVVVAVACNISVTFAVAIAVASAVAIPRFPSFSDLVAVAAVAFDPEVSVAVAVVAVVPMTFAFSEKPPLSLFGFLEKLGVNPARSPVCVLPPMSGCLGVISNPT